jgi:hypothetical protein
MDTATQEYRSDAEPEKCRKCVSINEPPINAGRPPHVCPHAAATYNDDTPCNCCKRCEYECIMEMCGVQLRPDEVQRRMSDACENLSQEEQFALYYRLQSWLESTADSRAKEANRQLQRQESAPVAANR